MDRKEIVKKLNNYVKSIDSDFSVELWFKTDLVLVLKDSSIATFNEFDPNNFTIDEMDETIAPTVAKTKIINKFYEKVIKLLKNAEIRYTVRVSYSPETYLHVNGNVQHGDILFEDLWCSSMWENRFTKLEIEELKQRDDLAIDWDKAIIEKVEE